MESTRDPVNETVDWLIMPDETAIAFVEKGENVDSTMIGSLIEPDIVAVVVAALPELLDKTISPLVERRLGPIDKKVLRLLSNDALGAVVKIVLMALAEGTLGVLKAVSFPLVGVVADTIFRLLLEELVDIALGPDVEIMLLEPVGGKLEDDGTLLLTLVEKVLDAAIEIGFSVFVEASVGLVAVTVLSSLEEALDPLVSTILLVLVRGMLGTMIVTELVPLIEEVLDLIAEIRLLVLAGGTLDPVIKARLLVLAKKVPDPVVGTGLLMLNKVAVGTVSVENPMLLVKEMFGIAVDIEVLSNIGEPLVRMVIKVLLSPAKVEVVPTFEMGFVALTGEKLDPPIVKVPLVLGEDTVPKLLVVEIPSRSMLETLNTIVDVTVIDSVMLELSLGEVLVLLVPDVEVVVTF
jgi:hypothetical protein